MTGYPSLVVVSPAEFITAFNNVESQPCVKYCSSDERSCPANALFSFSASCVLAFTLSCDLSVAVSDTVACLAVSVFALLLSITDLLVFDSTFSSIFGLILSLAVLAL